ncbi:site-2 protease family protein [Fictibacillus iocasae]|uniref:Site-2 protease family protein n=1 Tax=Fictibacillus iocasae TaxID=2715437 RepID=A0ABW2NVA5_9BACL
MDGFFRFSLEELPFIIISLVVAFTVHEWAHAYTAYKCGDNTAKNQGRLTFNPAAHIDPLGALLILIVGFGWARPVPVDRRNFKRPHLYSILVSAAGPLSNLLIALFTYVLLFVFDATSLIPLSGKGAEFVSSLLGTMLQLNIVLFLFNLLPFPPLDGYRILEDLAPDRIRTKMMRYESYGAILFLVIVLTPLDQYVIYPIFDMGVPFVINTLYKIISPLFM